MKRNAVLVDVSIDQGGCFETSRRDDPHRPDLRGRRHHPLLRGQHARRGADHLDLGADQRDDALRRSSSPTTACTARWRATRASWRASTSPPAASPTSRSRATRASSTRRPPSARWARRPDQRRRSRAWPRAGRRSGRRTCPGRRPAALTRVRSSYVAPGGVSDSRAPRSASLDVARVDRPQRVRPSSGTSPGELDVGVVLAGPASSSGSAAPAALRGGRAARRRRAPTRAQAPPSGRDRRGVRDGLLASGRRAAIAARSARS